MGKIKQYTISFAWTRPKQSPSKSKKTKIQTNTVWFKPLIVLLASIFGAILYFLLPAAYQIFSFIVPAVAIAYGFSKTGINFPILILFGLIFLLFPSSFFTLDATTDILYNWDYVVIQNFINNTVNVLAGIMIIGLPIITCVGAIYAFVMGNVEQAIANIVKVVLIIILVTVFLFIANIFKIPVLGNLGGVRDIANFITDIIEATGNTFSNVLNKTDIFDWFPTMPQIPDIQLDSLSATALDVRGFRLIIIGSYPLNLCLFGGVISIITLIIKKPFPSLNFDNESELSRPYEIQWGFLIFLVVILVAYFTLYLWLPDSEFLTYRNMGFFTIYLVIIVASCIVLAFGLGSVSKLSWNSLLGIVYGLIALFIVFNLFTQDTTLKLLSAENSIQTVTIYNVISQFIAVAPAESFLFHVFIPALSLYPMLLSIRRFNNRAIDDEILQMRQQIERLQSEVNVYEVQLLKPKIGINLEKLQIKDIGDSNDYLNRIVKIQDLTNRIHTFESEKKSIVRFNSKLSITQKLAFYVVCILSNFLFACMHYFNSGQTFTIFWISGLGLIYFLSGLILTFIAFRYGWLSAIIVHALNNSWGLIMLLLGGI